MIPKIRAAIEGYQLRSYGDYRAWPGPNSNTFVTAVLAAVPELQARAAADGDRQGLSLQWRRCSG